MVVVVNLSHMPHENYSLGFPAAGTWRMRFNSDWNGYSQGFANEPSADVEARVERSPDGKGTNERDGFPASGLIRIGAYSTLIYSRDR